MRKRLTESQKYPYHVKIPKNASHDSGFYGRFEILQQTKVVCTYSDNPTIVRCSEPFILLVRVNGKDKALVATK